MNEALCRPSGTTLDIIHAEGGLPITQRTLGLTRCPRDRQQLGAATNQAGTTPGPFLANLAMTAGSRFSVWATMAGGVCASQSESETAASCSFLHPRLTC